MGLQFARDRDLHAMNRASNNSTDQNKQINPTICQLPATNLDEMSLINIDHLKKL